MGVILFAVVNIQPSLPLSLLDWSHVSSDPSSPEDRSPGVAVFLRGRSQVKWGWRRGSAEPSRVDPTPTESVPREELVVGCASFPVCTLTNEASPPSTEGPGRLGDLSRSPECALHTCVQRPRREGVTEVTHLTEPGLEPQVAGSCAPSQAGVQIPPPPSRPIFLTFSFRSHPAIWGGRL